MAVIYEWDCETVADGESVDHEDGEVIDHCHGPSFREVSEWSKRNPCESGFRHALVLVRDDDDRRAWAYVEGGKLPEWFTDAEGNDWARVPKRFHAEVSKGA
jgi:hypothetical protein